MLLLAISRIIQLALTFAGIKIATTLMTPSEMARVYLITSLFSIAALFFINPVGMFINRRLNTWNKNGTIRGFFALFWLYVSGVGLVVYLLLSAVYAYDVLPFPRDRLLAVVVSATLISATLNQTAVPSLNLIGHQNWFNLLTVITGVTSLMVSYWAVTFLSVRAEFWQFGVICGNLIGSLWGLALFYKKINKLNAHVHITSVQLTAFVAFTLPIAATAGLGWVQSQSYRFLMETSVGLNELGLFAAGYGISVGLISAWESILTAYLYPRFYKRISTHELAQQSEAWTEYAQAMLPSIVLVGFLVLACSPELARAMLGQQFYSAKDYAGWGAVAEVARVGAAVFAMVAHIRMATRTLLVPALASATLSLGMIFWWLPLFESDGVGAALMISSIVLFALTYLIAKPMLAIKFTSSRVLKSLVMGICLFGLSGFLRGLISDIGIVSTLYHLAVVGTAFIGFQYVLLKPFLKAQ